MRLSEMSLGEMSKRADAWHRQLTPKERNYVHKWSIQHQAKYGNLSILNPYLHLSRYELVDNAW